MITKVTNCAISGDTENFTYLDLGEMPIVNNLCDTREESLNCPRFPLAVAYWPLSGLSSLTSVVDPEELFTTYTYQSNTSKPYIDHCKKMYDDIASRIKIEKHDYFIDIGGNDGTLLASFKEKNPNINVLNVDPSQNITELSRLRGVTTLTAMWNSQTAKMVGKAKVITSTNVFQHTPFITDFAKAVQATLHDDGIWVLEFPYWKNDLETNQYDQVYHEHIFYYTITPLVKLFTKVGLTIISVSKQSIHGGSLRIISRKSKDRDESFAKLYFGELLADELGLTPEYYKEFGGNVKRHIKDSVEFLANLKGTVAGFGAAAKGCIFLNATNTDYTKMKYVVDDTKGKQGKFIPGTGIPVVGREILLNEPTDYLVILAHNFKDHLMESVRPIYKGKFVIFFPEPHII